MATDLVATKPDPGSDTPTPTDERLERIVWKGLGIKSVRQISLETGLAPEEVLRVKNELLDSVDVLTVQQRRQKILVDLQEVAQRVQDDYDSSPMEFRAGLMNSAVSAMKTILVELNRTQKGEEDAVSQLNALRVKELLSLIDEVVLTSVQSIAKEHGLDEDELLEVFAGNLRAAAARRDVE